MPWAVLNYQLVCVKTLRKLSETIGGGGMDAGNVSIGLPGND